MTLPAAIGPVIRQHLDGYVGEAADALVFTVPSGKPIWRGNFNALVGWRVGSGMMARIRTGEIVIDMIRPLNYRTTILASSSGFAVIEGAISFGIAIGLGLLFFDIRPPDGPLAGALFALSVLLGFVTKVLVIFLMQRLFVKGLTETEK